MKTKSFWLAAVAACVVTAQAADYPLVDAVEGRARGGVRKNEA